MGYKLGISIEDLKRAVSRLQPVEHRLELKLIGNLYIIDDAYNSNPVGAKDALEVLGMMPGEKIVVTPGMIELGEKQWEENKKLGMEIAEQVDYAILVGEEQTKPIYEGLLEAKFNENHIYVLKDVKQAFPLIQKIKKEETYVLLENDLPDLFNE